MNVLLYYRPPGEKLFWNIANGVFRAPSITTYSDYNHVAEIWAGKYIYDNRYDVPNKDFDNEANDILPRCRTLRKMPPELAYRLARMYWNGMEELFTKNHFDFFLTIPIDCYTLDIICRVASRHGVKIISFVASSLSGFSKITLRGEYNKVREEIPYMEVMESLKKMGMDSYLSASEIISVKKTHLSIYKFYYRRFLIENFYYPLRRLWENDPYNYHYNIYEVKNIPFSRFYNRKFEEYFTHIDELDINSANTVYYPMHLIPEATTDYWCQDIRTTNYNQYVLDMIGNADKGITFIIKEHPTMYGRRQLSFYDALNSLPNVILLHPMDRSNDLLPRIENVVVDNGTVGVEALIRGKRLLCISDNYYYRFHPNASRVERVTMEALHTPIRNVENYDFMKKLLQGCFPSDFVNDPHGMRVANAAQIVKGIKSYLEVNELLYK